MGFLDFLTTGLQGLLSCWRRRTLQKQYVAANTAPGREDEEVEAAPVLQVAEDEHEDAISLNLTPQDGDHSMELAPMVADTQGSGQSPGANSPEPRSPADESNTDLLGDAVTGSDQPEDEPRTVVRPPRPKGMANDMLLPEVDERSPLGELANQHRSIVEATPQPQLPGAHRYIVDSGQVVGVKNTVHKYKESKPVQVHTTPFTERVDRAVENERRATALLGNVV